MEDNNQNQRKSQVLQEFNSLKDILGTTGWKVYTNLLVGLIEDYSLKMDNENLSPELLKNCQLIKKGLQMAYEIPKVLEIRAKNITRGVNNG